MRKRFSAIGVPLGALAFGVMLGAAGVRQIDSPNRALAEGQVKIAREALQELEKLKRVGVAGAQDLRIATWERREVEALKATGAPKEEIIRALEKHLSHLKEQARFSQQLFESGQATKVVVLDAEYRALEIEMWLNELKAQ